MKKAKSPALGTVMRAFRKAWLKHHQLNHTPEDIERIKAFGNSRRKFIGNVSKAAAMVAIGSSLSYLGCNPADKQKRIVIVGAGMAGLNSAYTLLKKAGIKATIYEADKRTGGRMYTQREVFGEGLWTEFGGEFLDSNHDDMFDLVEEFELETIDTYEDTAIRDAVFFEGKHFTEEDLIHEFSKVIPKLEGDLLSCGPQYDTAEAVSLDLMPLDTYINALDCAPWFKDLLMDAYMAEFGLDCNEQSSLNFLDMIDLDVSEGFKVFGDSDERYKVVGGNQRIPEILTEKLSEQIVMEHKLTAIKSNGTGYTLTFNGDKEVEADYVVMAIPFTILREIDMEIEGMSAEKRKCIMELGYGQNNKVMLGMKSRVWREGDKSHAGFLFHKNIHNGWDNSQMQNNNEGPAGYTVFLGGQESLDVAAAAKANGMKDTVPEERIADYTNQLDQVFPGFKDAYGGMHKAALWSNNPFVKGSYACYKPGQWSTISGYEFEPVGNLHFAGEHCSVDFLGYMNGAAETGRMAAEDIISKI
jgi:monoamine oxidase